MPMSKGPFLEKSKKSSTSPPIALASVDDVTETSPANLHFRVPAEFHTEFKVYAAQHGMTMVNLLQASFWSFKQNRSA